MPRNARKEGFSRRHRFAARGSFGPVLRGTRKLRGRFVILHVVSMSNGPKSGTPDKPSRLGIALTRRLVPAATDRSRVKRLVRETFRRHAVKNAGLDCVVTLRERIEGRAMEAMAAEIRELFDRACRNGASA